MTRSIRLVAACVCLAALPWSSATAQAALDVGFGDEGLASVGYAGEPFLQDGTFRVWGVAFRAWNGQRQQADLAGEQRLFDADTRQLVLAYPWGEVRCAYNVQADQLRLGIEVENQSGAVLTELALSPMETRFPQPPQGWVPHMPYRGFNLGWPTVNVAECETATLVVCNEDVGRPLQVGWAGRESLAARPMIVSTVSDWAAELINPQLHRPIYPGQVDRFDIALRFAPAGTDPASLSADLERSFAEAYPPRLEWADRRPIGALFLSTSELGAPDNPRGWFHDKETEFASEEGRRVFRERLLAHARQSLEVLQGLDCQGMVTWDIEGQEYPHAISYLGDPRSLPPEMEAAVDEYFKVFSDAGLRTGICIRPQLPVRAAYADGVRQVEAADPAAVLDAKITHAKERWGCTLFYVDSNGDPNVPLPASVFEAVAARHPDVLLMPEHENAAYYAHTAPYRDYANLKQLGTPEVVRRIYPGAFSNIYVGHGDPEPVRDQLLEAVRHGDILVVHGWYDSPSHPIVKGIYEEAARGQ
ncbi:MAG: hypothetical protein ISS72_08270 [Candidatus Brocadiae bacterium]|nr:hypothetical protein [Candidatus Brocadiia bacterium]